MRGLQYAMVCCGPRKESKCRIAGQTKLHLLVFVAQTAIRVRHTLICKHFLSIISRLLPNPDPGQFLRDNVLPSAAAHGLLSYCQAQQSRSSCSWRFTRQALAERQNTRSAGLPPIEGRDAILLNRKEYYRPSGQGQSSPMKLAQTIPLGCPLWAIQYLYRMSWYGLSFSYKDHPNQQTLSSSSSKTRQKGHETRHSKRSAMLELPAPSAGAGMYNRKASRGCSGNPIWPISTRCWPFF